MPLMRAVVTEMTDYRVRNGMLKFPPIKTLFSSIRVCTALAVLAGCWLSTLAWEVWFSGQSDRSRNPCRLRGWVDYVGSAEPRRTNETLVLLLSNSQGFAPEVATSLAYPRQVQELRAEEGRPVRVVNWSVPGWQYNDMMVIAAAARRLDASAILVVLMPDSFSMRERPPEAIGRWASDLYYLLGDRAIRERVPESSRADMVDLSLRANIVMGTLWPAWRVRSLPAALLSRDTVLGCFFDPDNTMAWFGLVKPRKQLIKRPIPKVPAEGDEGRAVAFLDVLREAAPIIHVVNMPVQSRFRCKDANAWPMLDGLCRERGIRTWDWADQIPEDEFGAAIAHFTADGHRRMAGRLTGVLP